MKFLNSIVCFFLCLGAAIASETVVLTENFEEPPNQWITLQDGVKGKAGRFNGEVPLSFRGDYKVTRFELELAFKPENLEEAGTEPPEWLPVFRTAGQWTAGAFQLPIIKGKFALHFHNGGSKRIRIESPPLENGRWYRARIVLDTVAHQAAMFLDGKEIGSMDIDPEIFLLSVNAPTLGSINSPKGIAFKGLMDEFKLTLTTVPQRVSDDPRNIVKGNEIPCELYCDQPYIVVLKDGTWVCTMTTGRGHEGDKGQHVVATRSTDQGKTWGPLIDIEPAGEISASWVVPLLTSFGRIYGFYTFNGDRVKLGRDDTHGWYAYRYSDDGGLTWSKDRYRIPMRRTACDTLEVDGKLVQMFWGICKPRIEGADVFIPFSKLGKYFLEEGEGWIMHSDNIMTEKDPEKIRWEMLPDGEHGIRHPEFGSVQEEHNMVPLDQKDSFMCVYRTTEGFPACSYSRDRCKSWSLPEPMTYATERTIRHPRACPMTWKAGPGRYLFWCHNNGGKWFENRNPAWLCVGLERDGKIHWGQPEIAIYADEPELRMSYPDLVHLDGKFWISETQKEVARTHSIDAALLDAAWKRLADELDGKPSPLVRDGLVLETKERKIGFPDSAKNALKQKGFSLDFTIDVPQGGFKPEVTLIDNRDAEGKGFVVLARENGAYGLQVVGTSKEPRDTIRWDFDPEILTPGKHRITITVEAAPRLVLSIADGQYVDGNGERVFGWGRYFNAPDALDGSGSIRLAPEIEVFRFYDRPLKTFEATSNQSIR